MSDLGRSLRERQPESVKRDPGIAGNSKDLGYGG
jgi:hypothetical protein